MTFMLRAVGDSTSEKERVLSVEPQAGFAVKTKVDSCASQELEIGVKYFINICHAAEVPSPDVPFEPSIVYPLIMANKWEIPIVTSAARQDQDKKGAVCYVSDCCVNTSCLEWARRNAQLKEILVEWCLESCELRQNIELNRTKLAFPKLRYKGSSIPTLEILREDLNSNSKDVASAERDAGPQSFLDMRRDLMESEYQLDSSTALPPLFPAPQTDRKLVEEIEPATTTRLKIGAYTEAKAPLNLDVSIGKALGHAWAKLKVVVHSELMAQRDYDVRYAASDNSLIVQTTKEHPKFQSQQIHIPLPQVIASSNVKLNVSFDQDSGKLHILI
ncbi:LADA_0E06766g1_1 [Lachancea dasiensis]|uniref:LADA_0E06766g1_1 n=1 Tax=Lachancea dasiensis TaxID=1072105 RepID=A0A1G4JCT8_9SACH|nr:LADA_0E06766g1_1 [Lachancea dasiensis]